MWNLSALAAKAQEAAARIERQLDESTGVKDDGAPSSSGTGGIGLGGGAGAASTIASSVSATHDDLLNDDDDFFSDDIPSSNGGGGWNDDDDDALNFEHEAPPAPAKAKEEEVPAATKLNVTADEGDDFFGDEITPSPVITQISQPQPTQSAEEVLRGSSQHSVEVEEVDFGDDDDNMGGGNGWDADEIPLDDDDGDDEVVEQVEPVAQQEVQKEEPITVPEPEPEPEPVMSEQVVEDYIHEAQPEESSHDMAPTNELTFEPEPFLEPVIESNEVEAMSEDIVFEEEGDTPDNVVQEEEYVMPVDEGTAQNELQTETVVSLPPPPAASIPETQLQMAAPAMDDTEKQQFLATIAELESQLYRRETQLASKSDQITSLSMQHEAETTKLRQAITETKAEAKTRIVRAKDRVEEMQTKLADAVRRADAAGGSNQEQSDMISALRAEGENLARKQSKMEQSVRSARGEARDLQEQLETEKDARQEEQAKVESLEKEVKTLKEELSSARKGETLSKKLEGELVAAKEESEKQRASNMVLEQQLKELKEEKKSLKKEVEESKSGAALELEGESNKLKRERDDMLGDLESKLRTSEREANVREDALRHEVSELRKRWQDAVRRAEDLSMDVQHSTAPLMRQLESTERQNRARAAGWAELETKLRSDHEESVVQLDKLTKERNDLVSTDKRSQRLLKEKEEEIISSQEAIDTLSSTIETLENRVEELEEEEKKIKQELVVAQRKANEGATKAKNEMLQSIVESEQRYQSQIDALEEDLDGERHRRGTLERQLDELAESVAAAEFAHESVGGSPSPAKEKKLRSATDQASILHDTLAGFDSEVDDDNDDEGDVDEMNGNGLQSQGGSFAAMEQLSLGLKGAKVELEALRKQLASSEETRESLLEELGEARQAVEKLPLFEQKVSELTMEIKMKDMEIQALQEDVADIKFLYRSQLDALLEEKAATPASTPSQSTHLGADDENPVLKIEESS